MAVNTSKTKFIVFRTRGKPINPADCQVVYNSNETGSLNNPLLISPIERIRNDGNTKSFKLLGVHLDKYLSFDAHIDNICSNNY
jgi:hypothetical protein